MLEIYHNVELCETEISNKKKKKPPAKGSQAKAKNAKDTLIKGLKL
jgi:hypothetical protein